MTDLTLDDRTFEDSDGTWTRLRFVYGSPWSNGEAPDVTVIIHRYERGPDGRFDLKGEPRASMLIHLDEVSISLLAGYLGAVSKLMWHQWAQYDADEKARARDGAG